MARSSQGTVRAVAVADSRPSVNEQLHELLQAFQVGVILHGPHAEIQFANKTALDMFGMSLEELCAEAMEHAGWTVVREDGTECPFSLAPIREAIESRQPIAGLVLGWRRPGADSILWTQVTIVPQVAKDGNVAGVINTLTDITERKRAEMALAERTGFLNLLIENTPLALVAIRADHTVQLCNPAFEKLFRYRQEDILGRPLYELLVVPEIRPDVDNSRDRVWQGLTTHIVARRGRSDGSLVDVEGFSVPLFSEGKVTGAVLLYQDITERKKMESALRSAAELNQQIVHSAQEGIVVHDRALRYTLWNPYMERMSGLKAADVIGRHPLELFPLLRERGVYGDLKKALAGEVISSHGVPYSVPQTNQRGWMDNNFAPLRDDTGTIIGVVATVRDITERTQEEKKLRRSEALLSQAEQMTGCGSWELDLATGKSTLSKNLLQIYGLASEAQWDRQEYWARIHPGDRHRARADIERATAECKPFEHILRYRKPDGTHRIHSVRAIQIAGPDGRTERSIGVAQDITEQTRREEELRQLSGRLLQMQDEERRRIAREIHDEISQNLMVIGLNLAQLSDSADVRGIWEKKVLAETRKMIRGLSKEIRSSSYLLHPPLLEELGLASAIEEYANGFSERSGIDLGLELPSDPTRMPRESEMALFRVVQEALGNMQKHSGASTGNIRLRRDGDELVLEISDSGHGIARKNLEKQLGNAGRFGVGILGMRERMRQLGGRLEISSGEWGTEVKAVLPAQDEGNDGAPNLDSR